MRVKFISFSIVLSLLFACMGFSCSAEAQYYDTNVPQPQALENISKISDPLRHIFLMLERIDPLISQTQHGSAEETFLVIPSETIIRILDESKSYDEFFRKVRVSVVQFLIDNQYSNFNMKPYAPGSSPIVEQSGDFKVLRTIEAKDMLDALLFDKLALFQKDFIQIKKLNKHLDFNPIIITTQEYETLGPIFLFKDDQDLRDLGYELISWKSRINTDVDYRRHNIMAAFYNIGNVRVIMPGQVFSTLKELHYNPGQGEIIYVEGLVTVGNGAKMIYGGGLCGVATALYQGALTNLGFSLVEYRPHSIYYRNLYEADINGITITEPGLDATIFSPVFDLKLKNIRDYPIIVGFAFDGGSGSQEQVFTISKAQDKGSFEYVHSYKKGTYSCFTWKINGENRTNCYRKVKNY